MTLKQIKKAIKTAHLTLVAVQIADCNTIYLRPDMNDLDEALECLFNDGVKRIRAHIAKPSNVLYIGE